MFLIPCLLGVIPPPEPPAEAALLSSETEISLYGLYHQPTPAVRPAHVALPWDPQQALLLTVPLADTLDREDELQFVVGTIHAALPFMPVWIFVNPFHEQAVPFFQQTLVDAGVAEAELSRIRFFNAKVTSRWIRDYAPLQATDETGLPLFIDPVYTRKFQDYLLELPERWRALKDVPFPVASLRSYAVDPASLEDRFPAELARIVRAELDQPVRVVRPPFFLEGGDFHLDGRGNLFVSQRTLHDNGGDEARLSELFREYFGVQHIHYLRELPRSKVDHLDYILKFTDPDTVLLAQWPGFDGASRFDRDLYREIAAVLAYNEKVLRKARPELEIISVPFLPPARDSETVFLDFIRDKILRNLAWQNDWISPEVYRVENNLPLPSVAEKAVYRLLREKAGIRDLDTSGQLDRALLLFFDTSLADLREVYPDQQFYFRSYLNGVFLNNAQGESAFLLPRFQPLDGVDAARIAQAEQDVTRAFLRARPEAQISWIPADSFARRNGAVHCSTQVLPVFPETQPSLSEPAAAGSNATGGW
jgi:agmatine/peptidylarginine deiminase